MYKGNYVHTTPKALPKREGPVWATVKVLSEHATSPSLQCLNYPAKFYGATRIKDHITGGGALACCPCETDTCGDGWLVEGRPVAYVPRTSHLHSVW